MPGNAERVQHQPERLRPRGVDRGHEVARRGLAEALERGQPLLVEVVDAGDVGDQPLVEEAVRVLLAEPVDVHRADEVLDGLEQLAGTGGAVGADRPDPLLGLDRRRVAGRAALGRVRRLGAASCGAAPWRSARPPAGSRRRRAGRSPRRRRARPCGAGPPRCAASPASRPRRRRSPARAGRTGSCDRCGRRSRPPASASWSPCWAGTSRRSRRAARARRRRAGAAGRCRRP